jgi:beta-lactamase superfamily II metal-dependent hydrolase
MSMRKVPLLALAAAIALSYPGLRAQQPKGLDIYFVDVEGGQATLFVSPSGQSMMVDTGFPGARDADRIAAVAKQAGISAIDYQIITHYHGDHVGGVATLVTKLPIRTFVDHGPNMEGSELGSDKAYETYTAIRDKAQHILAKPGDKLPIKGIDVQVVSAAQKVISKPLPGAGADNPLCSDFKPKDEQQDRLIRGENKASVGTVISYGRFRMVDFGDLTWNAEHELACPKNLIGTVDLYLTTHHGQNISGLPMLVHALRPRVVVMNNGAKKGGHPDTFQVLHHSPGLEDLWQLHFAVDAGKDDNSPEQLIANPDETTAHYIKVTARNDGSFTVTNNRNGYHKDYAPRR